MSAAIVDRFYEIKSGGVMVHTFLSNFYRSRLTYGDVEYSSVEAAFQAHKTMDHDLRREIAKASWSKPGVAKRMGRALSLREDWLDIRDNVMRGALRAKFDDGALRLALLNTGDALLIEGNTWHDNYWGDCVCGRPGCAAEGTNRLGQMLMALRGDILAEFN